MKTIVNSGRDFANSVANLFGREAGRIEPQAPRRRRRILVVGGGRTGLAFATSLHALGGAQVDLTIADARWIEDRGYDRAAAREPRDLDSHHAGSRGSSSPP